MPDTWTDGSFRDICLHAGIALIAADQQLRIRFWNPAASRMLGSSAEVMVGQPISSIVPAERRELASRLCARALAHGETSELDFQYRNSAGEPRFLAVTLSPIVDPAGRRTGVSVYVRDVTRRMSLEREMAEGQKMSALGVMAGQVAHHFNNMLGGVITALDFAQSSDDPEALRRAMGTAISALTRASALTQGLLTFAEGDPRASAMGDLMDIVRQYASELEPRLAAQNIRLELAIEPVSASLPVRQIRTILDNLTANAREAMPEGGTLRVELKPAPVEPRAILRVRDSGCGIDPEDLPRVFEPFFTTKSLQASSRLEKGGKSLPQLDKPGSQGAPCSGPHAGLGLAVVHGIVKEIGGSVTVGPSPGEGTICSVILPLQLK